MYDIHLNAYLENCDDSWSTMVKIQIGKRIYDRMLLLAMNYMGKLDYKEDAMGRREVMQTVQGHC